MLAVFSPSFPPLLSFFLSVLAPKQLCGLMELCEVPADTPYNGLLELCKAGELASEKHMAFLGLGRHRLQVFHWSPSYAHWKHSDSCEETISIWSRFHHNCLLCKCTIDILCIRDKVLFRALKCSDPGTPTYTLTTSGTITTKVGFNFVVNTELQL